MKALGAMLFACVFCMAWFSVHSPRTWLHLRAGRLIAESGGLPREDSFSYTADRTPQAAPDWLAERVFYGAFRAFGGRGLVGLKAALIAAAFAMLLPMNAGDPLLAAGTLALAASGAWPGFAELPAVFDFPLLALFISLLRPGPAFNPNLLWQLGLAEAAWVNLHPGGAGLGLLLTCLKAFTAGLKAGRRRRLGWLALVAATAAAFFIHPPDGGARSLFGGAAAVAQDSTLAPDLFNIYGLYLAAGLGAAWVCLQEEFFLVMAAMSLLAVSLASPGESPLYLLASGPLVALGLGRFLKPLAATRRRVAGMGVFFAALLLSYAVHVSWALGSLGGFTSRQTPEGALDFLDRNRVGGHMFNDLGSAPYIIWRAPPERPVFVDDRPGLYEPGFLKDAEEWPRRWTTLDATYRFDYAVVENIAGGYPCRALDEDPSWALAYWDDAALAYLRKGAANDRLLRKAAFRWLRPNDLFEPLRPEALSPANAAAALEELDRALLRAPGAVWPMLIKAMALDKLGRSGEAAALIASARERPFWKPGHHALLGAAFEARGDLEGALSSYRRARWAARRSANPRLESEVLTRVGDIRRRQGDAGGAQRAWRRAVALDPANDEAAAALRGLFGSGRH